MMVKRLFHSLLLLIFIVALLNSTPMAGAESRLQTSNVQEVLASMTPEERVGQLFLVAFQGTDTHDQTQIYDLIANHHVGGVVFLSGNDNFLPAPDTIPTTYQLISTLQRIESSATTTSATNAQINDNTYVPLFIGISQEGDGVPHDQILSGLTPLPSPMAIGATWDTELAQQVGAVLGSELSALGFNLYLGPSLDVVETPNPSARFDLGTRVFGGDPFWVGEMGREYISGVHAGSNQRMVVVAKHFPGRGASDRSPEEVATVSKSLEELKQIELLPFSAVTNSMEANELADGLLVSHIRYQGFQENIRATTRPMSLDESALSEVVALPEFATWRDNGGLIVSDALGSPAVRDFYSQTGEKFSPRLAARDAFFAGNDLLYLGNITSENPNIENPNEETYTATLGILEYFVQQYGTDGSFAQRVDEAVTRILAQKLRIYDEFTLSNVLAPENGLENIGASEEIVSEVARNAATLINPSPEELSTLLPAVPTQGERIAFLTDTSLYKQCNSCLWEEGFAADALQRAVLRLYGPEGSGQVVNSRLNSFPFTELELMLNGESQTDIESILESADWIVISLTDVGDGQIALLQRFFSERSNLIRNKKVILFSFTAPYYLDPTDISRFTAYYALYSKQPAFVEMAARLLFQQLVPLQGASPVSIPAIRYDLREATQPDPAQIIPLAEDRAVEATPTSGIPVTTLTVSPTQTEVPLYRIGDTISVSAGPIYDHNHHLVPDGTPVRFIMTTTDESGPIPKEELSNTVMGIARASFSIDRPGEVEIRAISEPALESFKIELSASVEGGVLTIVTPSVTAIIETPSPTATPVIVEIDQLITLEGYPRLGMWLLVMIALVGGAILMYWAVSRLTSPRWGLRWALCVFLGGLLAYNYLALGFPGATEWIATSAGEFGVLILTFAGQLIGSLGAWVWMQVFSAPRSQGD
jgi:beta-N-acetylhexosaminidase